MATNAKAIREWDRMIVRLPDGMKERLEDQAARNCRALNGEVLFLLERGLAAEKTASQPTV